MRVVLGNRTAIHTVKKAGEDGELVDVVEKMKRGKRATVIDIPDEKTLGEAFKVITDADGVWHNHAASDTKPAWVAVEGAGGRLGKAALAMLLSEHFGGVEIREYEEPPAAGGGTLPLMLAMPSLAFLVLGSLALQLRTNAGADFQAKQMGGAASATAVAKWMALTANVTAPAAGDTTLTGEITTGGGGLIRAAATYAHTGGASSYTMSNTFTANGSDSLPVTVGKVGVFDAASVGNLVFETLLGTTATLSALGDALTVTQTVTL